MKHLRKIDVDTELSLSSDFVRNVDPLLRLTQIAPCARLLQFDLGWRLELRSSRRNRAVGHGFAGAGVDNHPVLRLECLRGLAKHLRGGLKQKIPGRGSRFAHLLEPVRGGTRTSGHLQAEHFAGRTEHFAGGISYKARVEFRERPAVFEAAAIIVSPG